MSLLPKKGEDVLRVPIAFTDQVVDRPALTWVAPAAALRVRQYEPVQCCNNGPSLIDERQYRAQQLS